jgi:hypothetical protein
MSFQYNSQLQYISRGHQIHPQPEDMPCRCDREKFSTCFTVLSTSTLQRIDS